ncbi:uncharacterized protein A4U43_C04F30710 [Asparagus officinalis]|uniref:NAD(P)-binding domain-containing protein n=1 Tax=Asparagus officinalis TaxID=4686 RepID=A0A5P1F4T0_ASPOF|nr:uncharacterized protein A4U43_C04F30710 [Asparagus officinalis]
METAMTALMMNSSAIPLRPSPLDPATRWRSLSIMNLIGVLKFKKMEEDFIRSSGLPYTIIRAERLTDGPYTSYDLNTLIKATAGERRAVVIGQGDKLVGEVSRLVVAEACIQALDIDFTKGQISRKAAELSETA